MVSPLPSNPSLTQCVGWCRQRAYELPNGDTSAMLLATAAHLVRLQANMPSSMGERQRLAALSGLTAWALHELANAGVAGVCTVAPATVAQEA